MSLRGDCEAVDEAIPQGDDISTANQPFVYRLAEIASGYALATT